MTRARRLSVLLPVLALLAGILPLFAPAPAEAQTITPPSVPQNVTATVGNKRITLNWQAPSSWGQSGWTPRGYSIDWRFTGNSDATWRLVSGGPPSAAPTSTSYVFEGLQAGNNPVSNGSSYDLRIQAYIRNSDSTQFEYGSYVTLTGLVPAGAPEAPSGPSVTPGAERLDVSWPAPSNGGSAITGYDLHYKTWNAPDASGTGSDPSTGWIAAAHSGTSTTASIIGLTGSEAYYIVRVRAKNALGAGPWSEWAPLWTARLTAGFDLLGKPDVPTPALHSDIGCRDTTDSLARCDSASILTTNSFRFRTGDQVIAQSVRYVADRPNDLAFVPLFQGATLCVGTTAYAMNDAVGIENVNNAARWVGVDVGWSVGDQIFLRLQRSNSCAVVVEAPANDATLSGLTAGIGTSSTGTFSALTLSPAAFSASTTAYAATVATTATHLKLTPTAGSSNATVKVGKQGTTLATVASGSASGAIALDVGANAVTVEVTAADGTTKKTYTVTVTRLAGPPEVSLSASPNVVTEGSSVTVTASLSAQLAGAVTIPVTIADNTAEPGDHGSLTSIAIAAGQTTGTGTITTNQDEGENDDTFTVSLGTLPSSVTAGSPNSVLVTIWDDDKPFTLTATAIPACGSTATDMSTPVQYGLELVPAPAPGTQMNTDWVIVNDGGAHLANWQGALIIQDSGSTYFATGSTLEQYRAAFPGFAGFRFRLRDQPTIWTSCTWRFDDGGNGNTGGGNPPPTNDNPPPTNDNPPPTNNNPPPTDTGFGGGGGGGGGGSLASDASLRGLALRASADGENFDETPTLTPDFDADTLAYAAAVPFSMTHARLTPRTVNPDATVGVGPRGGERAELSVLEPSAVFALAIGENVFEVAVTAEDEETAQTYAVTVTRAPPPLRGLRLRASGDGENFGETLALTPAFEPSVTEYAATALFSMTHARLTPELGQEDATAQIGPRGGERSDAAGGAPGPALELAFGENVFEIVVTAVGGTAATYTVTVTRPAPPVPLDATAARQHLFPLLADGDGFRVRLFLTNVSAYPRNACALTLHGAGLDASRFEEHPALTVSDGALEIDSGPTGAGVALATGGAGELAFGYARLACAEPAAARLLLARESGGVPAALANQESARAARLHRFPLLSRLGRPGLALANDGDAAAACAVEVKTAAGESAGGGNVAVPARGVAFRFVDEIASRENGEGEEETDGGAVTVTCDRPVAALGLPLTAAGVFTALGGAVPEADETTEEAEAVAARRVLPLVLDGAGFRSRLEVTNRSDAANGCTLHFHGAGVNTARFPSSADLVKDGFRRATFELAQDERIAMTSFGRHSYAYGYAMLACEGPVEAHSLLTVGDGDEADGMAPIPPARFAREVRFPVAPGLDGMALFLTNAEETDAVCEASLTPAGGEETAVAASIEVGAESTALRFLADLFALPDDFAGGAVALSCDREIAAVALPTTAAAAFAALPPVAPGFRDDAQETEEEGN